VEREIEVGKTEVARVWPQILATRLIRLQCREGMGNPGGCFSGPVTLREVER